MSGAEATLRRRAGEIAALERQLSTVGGRMQTSWGRSAPHVRQGWLDILRRLARQATALENAVGTLRKAAARDDTGRLGTEVDLARQQARKVAATARGLDLAFTPALRLPVIGGAAANGDRTGPGVPGVPSTLSAPAASTRPVPGFPTDRLTRAHKQLFGALGELDGEDEDRRRGGAPNRIRISHQAERTKRDMGLARAQDRARIDPAAVIRARGAVRAVFLPIFYRAPAPVSPLDAALFEVWRQVLLHASGATAQTVALRIGRGTDPVRALAGVTIERALQNANKALGSRFGDGAIKVAAQVIGQAIGETGNRIAALPAVLMLIAEARAAARRSGGTRESGEALTEALDRMDGPAKAPLLSARTKSRAKKAAVIGSMVLNTLNDPLAQAAGGFTPGRRDEKQERHVRTAPPPPQLWAPPPPPDSRDSIGTTGVRDGWFTGTSGRFEGEAEDETGWEQAMRHLDAARRAGERSRSAPAAAPPIVAPGAAARAGAHPALPASEARRQLARAVAPAFAGAIDTAVRPELVVRFARQHPAAGDVAKVRHALVATAARQFAVEFVRTISAAPKGTSEHLALGAIIATALAHASGRFPVIPPAAVPAMSVLIHKALQPRLPVLARMAAAAAARPAAPAASTASPARESAW